MTKHSFESDLKLSYAQHEHALAKPMFKSSGIKTRAQFDALDEFSKRNMRRFKRHTQKGIEPRGKVLKRLHALRHASISKALPIVINALLKHAKTNINHQGNVDE